MAFCTFFATEKFICTYFPYFAYNLFENQLQKERDTQRDFPSAGSFPRWPSWPGLDQAEARSFF